MHIYTSEQIRIIDDAYLKYAEITHFELVKQAAKRLAVAFNELIPPEGQEVILFAGPGNNGADTLCLAAALAEKEYEVKVFLFNTRQQLSESCSAAWLWIKELPGLQCTEVVNSFVPPVITEECVVVDGLFGSGLTRPLEGGFASVVRLINGSQALVVSVDVPSGMTAEGAVPANGFIVRADVTLSIQHYKVNSFASEAQLYWGTIRLVPLFDEAFDSSEVVESAYELIDVPVLRNLLRERSSWSEKRDFGHGYLIAGSQELSGAAVLASQAALRSGVGLLTVHVPKSLSGVLQTVLPEALVESDAHEAVFTAATVKSYYAAVGIGPGIGMNELTHDALMDVVNSSLVPMVIDADAINIIAEYDDAIGELPRKSLLTPHVREFDRLFGPHVSMAHRVTTALAVAQERDLTIVLKGAHTAVVLPSGKVYLTAFRNSGLAKGGSGDVLMGILLSLMSQGYTSEEAAVLGCGVHAMAGHLALKEWGEHSMLPSDVIAKLGDVFRKLR